MTTSRVWRVWGVFGDGPAYVEAKTFNEALSKADVVQPERAVPVYDL